MDDKLLNAMTATIVDEVQPDAVIPFGSQAKRTDRPESDVDLLVVMPDSDEVRRRRRHFTGRLYRRL
ncbi:MAG TPA: nucleotidyltransferase domain-containing protein, partial [Candidatus Hydrogenedentes bacterium]|nr:nucleotidyltransferase domain-containing protein [Candidatus Hydrogenedentota bacterium]